MIGLDTNVLVRYLMQDEASQAAKASAFIESLTVAAPGFVALVTLVELAWVLRSGYRLKRREVTEAVEALLRTRELVVERTELVWKALRLVTGKGADFADALIAVGAAEAGCDRVVTFDRGAVSACGMVELV